jgi:hypothetical protein
MLSGITNEFLDYRDVGFCMVTSEIRSSYINEENMCAVMCRFALRLFCTSRFYLKTSLLPKMVVVMRLYSICGPR